MFFLPRLEAWKDVGAWLFFVGSLVYLVVLADDLIETNQFWPKPRPFSLSRTLESTALWVYVVGTVLFAVGSLMFVSWWDWRVIGAWLFLIGSALFVLGAAINVLMIIRASSIISLQLMNLIALNFIAGSGLFLVASIPYLWHLDSGAAEDKLFNFLAWQFLVGSVMFLIGGFLNHMRARVVMRHRKAAVAQDAEADARLLAFIRGEITERDYYANEPAPRP